MLGRPGFDGQKRLTTPFFVATRAETNTRFARVFARLHKYSDTKRDIQIHIYIDFLHYFMHFL